MSYQHEIPGGGFWSFPVRTDRMIKLTALGPDANATMLLFGPDRLDRLNIPDTMKAQMSARICPPMVLMSDRGLALASVVASTSDWHDCLNGFSATARTGLLIELAKHGLTEDDLHGSINFFTKVALDDDTKMTHVQSAPGGTVELRTEQDVLVVLSTVQHPLSQQDPAGIRIEVLPATEQHQPQRDEAARALEMSRRTLA
ncbi:DUF1989 domain-containing protein [Kribbella sp. NPDC006257]|uniref:DUF1989 domain-containing protein n=1 Tax=Kribbella sp. NPDC006257 TaxID=3156738 RepID=UPI0033A8A989